MVSNYISRCNRLLKHTKEDLYVEFTKTKQRNEIRHLNEDALNKYNIVSVFDSVLTRTIGINADDLTEDILIVQTYFFDVIEDIIINGFLYKGEPYICFTASAGQIRTKKTVFIKKSVWDQHQKTITCDLSLDKINENGGVNVNKYLAYLALCNSATDHWEDFDINKSIVVDDFETMVNSVVDFIDDKTYTVERREMEVPIPHTDGCGMILNGRKGFMVRLPWVKGLLEPFPYVKFINMMNKKNPEKNHALVTDIYGKEHDVINEDIQYIFTKSQFKMYKYYADWEDYQSKFIAYNCQAGICNMEKDKFNYAKLNYQMLQTLVDMTDEELTEISESTRSHILNIGHDRNTMLKVLGVVDANTNKNYIQQALTIYPELLGDTYSREILKQVKRSLVRDGRSGKLDIDGKYTFIVPDLYAFSEYLFAGIENPNGLLKDGEVFCRLYKHEDKLDCLRSPHLYKEHAVRKNSFDKHKAKWFVSNGLYTSCKDTISKILQFDCDGDSSLVCADHTIIEVAERSMKDVVPLYYDMKKAEAQTIDSESIYQGLKAAYTGGNIGAVSNDITKIWNSDNVSLEAVKLMCMISNYTIDYAKTLYKPTAPSDKKELLTRYTKLKTPHFFIYAKDKNKNKVEPLNNSVVNRLEKIIPNPRINFKATNLGEFDYNMLMSGDYEGNNIELDQLIVDKYVELDLNKRFISVGGEESKSSDEFYLYKNIRSQILEVCPDVKYVADVLVSYLYNFKNSNYKATLWSSFGDVLVKNLENNVEENTVLCEVCGERVLKINNRVKYCNTCKVETNRNKTRERMKNMRK